MRIAALTVVALFIFGLRSVPAFAQPERKGEQTGSNTTPKTARVLNVQIKGDSLSVEFQQRAVSLIDSAMRIAATRALEFNKRMSDINARKPLDWSSLDSVSIVQNRKAIADFVNFLSSYRADSRRFSGALRDSIGALRQAVPPSMRKDFLKRFQEAFLADVDAFDAYTAQLAKLYSHLGEVLQFMESADFSIVEKRMQFNSQPDYDRYMELMAPVEAAQKALAKAGEASAKAAELSNAVLEEEFGSDESVIAPD